MRVARTRMHLLEPFGPNADETETEIEIEGKAREAAV